MPLWVAAALRKLGARDDLFQSAWKDIRLDDGSIDTVFQSACEHHAAGLLFRLHRTGVVLELPPSADDDADAEEGDAHDDVEDDDGLLELAAEADAPAAVFAEAAEPGELEAAEAEALAQPEAPSEADAAPELVADASAESAAPAAPDAAEAARLAAVKRCLALRLMYGRGHP